MSTLEPLRAMGSVAWQLPVAVLRRGCHSTQAVGAGNAHCPVVLVHGYAGTDAVWSPLRTALRDVGFGHIVSLSYNSFVTDPGDVSAEMTRRALQAVDDTRAPGIHLVGHSLGGLIVRRALADSVALAGRAVTAVTIASPHRGARLARLAPGRCGRIMHPVNPSRADSAPLEQRVRWLSYYSDRDRIVSTTSARLVDTGCRATNVLIPNCGHLTICRDARFIRSLVAELIRTETSLAPAAFAVA
jgi:pimeloyl-ACP methyl ester carboxylesterase